MKVIDITEQIACLQAKQALIDSLEPPGMSVDESVRGLIADLLLYKYSQMRVQPKDKPLDLWLNPRDQCWPGPNIKPSKVVELLHRCGLIDQPWQTSDNSANATKPTPKLMSLLAAIGGPLDLKEPRQLKGKLKNSKQQNLEEQIARLEKENAELRARLAAFVTGSNPPW